jgi:osmoprotectant transport system substrate-binding protein
MPVCRRSILISCLVPVALALGLAACGGKAGTTATGTQSANTTTLPGTDKPAVTIGDKNLPEQFVLGDLYQQALEAKGFTVNLNPNIGPTSVTLTALASGRLDMYPEYLNIWDRTIAGDPHHFRTLGDAYEAGETYALSNGLVLLNPTPFSDTDAIIVDFNYGAENNLNTLSDVRKVANALTLGAPPQFQQDAYGLPAIEKAYNWSPSAVKPLVLGEQYQALDAGTVQAAYGTTTDGQLLSGNYTVLRDPKHVLGWGNVVPVVSAKALGAEGPAFSATVNKVNALLTTTVMRDLNAAVEVEGQEPAIVAKQFLLSHGLIPASAGS